MNQLRMGWAATAAAASLSCAPAMQAQGEQPSTQQQPTSHAVALPVPTGTVHGTLLRPSPAASMRTAAVIIAGSGPTDRDGNSAVIAGDNNSLRQLAEALAEAGIASIRYDKRGIGESTSAAAAEADLRFQHYVDDAAAWVARLRESGDFDRILVIGHSEGALIGTLAAQQTPVDGLVLIAGMGRSMATTVRAQLAAQLPPEMMVQVDSMLATIAHGRTLDNVPPMLAPLFRPSVQPYLRSVMSIEPAAELARVQVPVLIVSGTTDLQVSIDNDARRLAAAAPNARLVVIEGMNHILKHVDGSSIQQQLPSYGDPSLPLMPELIRAVTEFAAPPR
ncbi:alpha/beta hydrolase [soil metagenome]